MISEHSLTTKLSCQIFIIFVEWHEVISELSQPFKTFKTHDFLVPSIGIGAPSRLPFS